MRTVIWFVYFWLYLLAAIPVSGYIWWLEKRGRNAHADELVQGIVRRWARRLLRLAGAKVEVIGQDNLPDEPAVYVANHQGNFDIPILLTVLHEPHGLIAKQELAKLPFVRAWMRHLHCLFVDRSSPRAGAQVIVDGERLLESGRSVSIFPEGTRSRGGPMHRFQGGAFRIATRAGAPIVPVTIDGSYRLMEAQGFWIRPATVRVTIHPPVPTADLSREQVRSLPDQVHDTIVSVLP